MTRKQVEMGGTASVFFWISTFLPVIPERRIVPEIPERGKRKEMLLFNYQFVLFL